MDNTKESPFAGKSGRPRFYQTVRKSLSRIEEKDSIPLILVLQLKSKGIVFPHEYGRITYYITYSQLHKRLEGEFNIITTSTGTNELFKLITNIKK